MKVMKFLACLLVGGEASRAAVDFSAALSQETKWSASPDMQRLKIGNSSGNEDILCPSLVPKEGETFNFNVRQYKNNPMEKMSYHFQLHKVNEEVVDLSVGAGKGTRVWNDEGKQVWRIRRHFGAAKVFGKRMSDSLYKLSSGSDKKKGGGQVKFTLRRIALTIPQRWTIHADHVYRKYDASRLYWIKGHMGKYNVFKNPEDSRAWTKTDRKKRAPIEHTRVAYIRRIKDPQDGHDTHVVVCKEGVDCALILSMLQVFRWEHYVSLALTLMPAAQWRTGYQSDDGRVPFDSTGKNPVLIKRKKEGHRHQGVLAEMDEDEVQRVENDQELEEEDELDDDLDDTELAEYFENTEFHDEDENDE